jgi:cobalamin biosynthesis protein CbiD
VEAAANLRTVGIPAQKGSSMARARIRSLAMAATLMTASLVAVPAARADPLDDKFIAALQSRDIHYNSVENAIAAAHQVCAELNNGDSKAKVAQDVIDQTDLDPYHAGYFVGASVGAYCSQYSSVN